VRATPVSTLTGHGKLLIDYFSLDVEGAELAALDAIDWDKVQIDVFTSGRNGGGEELEVLMRGNGYRPSMKIGPDVLYVHRDARVANEHLADVEAVAVGEVVSPMGHGAQHVRIRSDGTIHIEFAFAVAELLPRSTIQFSIAGIREAGLTFPFLPEGGSTVECNLPGGTLTAWDCCSFSVRVFDEWGLPVFATSADFALAHELRS